MKEQSQDDNSYIKSEDSISMIFPQSNLIVLMGALNTNPKTGDPFGNAVGVRLDNVRLTETSLVLYISIDLSNPITKNFKSKTFQYISIGDGTIIKKYIPNISTSKIIGYTIENVNTNRFPHIYPWNTSSLSRGDILMKRRHSVRRKTLDPTTGKLKCIRTAPRFTKDNRPLLRTQGYYRVYTAYNHFKSYIGDVVITANKWEIENGKRVPVKYTIKGI